MKVCNCYLATSKVSLLVKLFIYCVVVVIRMLQVLHLQSVTMTPLWTCAHTAVT